MHRRVYPSDEQVGHVAKLSKVRPQPFYIFTIQNQLCGEDCTDTGIRRCECTHETQELPNYKLLVNCQNVQELSI